MADHAPAQADFIGGLAAALLLLAIAAAVFMLVVGMSAGPSVDIQETPPAVEQAAEPVPAV